MRPPSFPIPDDAAVVRDRRTKERFLARELHTTQREVRFMGQLIHEDSNGVRLYPARLCRLTRSRAEILTSEGDEL
jgi:hypothetical protein